jgi:two-component system sensor histidine kinase KdpD
LQAGTLGITIRPTSVAEIMAQATRQLEVLVTEHTLYIDAPDDLPPVQADPRRIAQVITNLVSNSVKFAPSHTDIGIKASHKNGTIQISVSDRGPGIPPSERDRVFEVFFQLSNPDMKRQGAGLGLAICKGLIERHGGHIWIEERSEPGATIAFTLPVAP